MSRLWQVSWFTIILLGFSWLGIRTMMFGVPSPSTDVSLIDLSLRVAHMAAAEWGNAITGLAMIGGGFVLALCCFIPSLHEEGGYVSDVFDSGDGD
ncbi:MAG: hypothetical protein AAFR73_01075 [Pseudomonadota bacterium]